MQSKVIQRNLLNWKNKNKNKKTTDTDIKYIYLYNIKAYTKSTVAPLFVLVI